MCDEWDQKMEKDVILNITEVMQTDLIPSYYP